MDARNCFNRLALSDEARGVTEYTAAVKDELAEKSAGKVFSLGRLRLYECPLSYITAETAELMRAVFLVDGSGHLLFPGGWGGQPAWLVEAYEVYKAEVSARVSGGGGGKKSNNP